MTLAATAIRPAISSAAGTQATAEPDTLDLDIEDGTTVFAGVLVDAGWDMGEARDAAQFAIAEFLATHRISWGDPDYYWSARSIRAFARDWIGQP